MTVLLPVPVTVAVNCCCCDGPNCAVDGDTDTAIGTTVTVAAPDFVGSACDVAVTVTVAGFGTVVGAVYRPPLVIVPHAAPLQPAPERLHVTVVLFVPVTVAVNCCWPAVGTWALLGETATLTTTMVTVAVADFVGSAFEVAVTLTADGVGTLVGAV